MWQHQDQHDEVPAVEDVDEGILEPNEPAHPDAVQVFKHIIISVKFFIAIRKLASCPGRSRCGNCAHGAEGPFYNRHDGTYTITIILVEVISETLLN